MNARIDSLPPTIMCHSGIGHGPAINRGTAGYLCEPCYERHVAWLAQEFAAEAETKPGLIYTTADRALITPRTVDMRRSKQAMCMAGMDEIADADEAADLISMLGKCADEKLANLHGVGTYFVTLEREQRGIPEWCPPRILGTRDATASEATEILRAIRAKDIADAANRAKNANVPEPSVTVAKTYTSYKEPALKTVYNWSGVVRRPVAAMDVGEL